MALGRLSSQANNSMGYVRIFARAVSNPGPPDYSFDDIITVRIFARVVWNPGPPDYSFDYIITMSFTTVLSSQIAEW